MGMAVCTTLHSRPKLFLLIFDNIEKRTLNVFQRILMILASILNQWKKVLWITVIENVLWDMLNRVKHKSLTADPTLLFNCKGSYCCKSPICKATIDFKVTLNGFERSNNQMIFALCRKEVVFIPFITWKILLTKLWSVNILEFIAALDR